MRFLDDGRLGLDRNPPERALRCVALIRKNALFVGSNHGAENWAMLASLIKTCKLHRANPQAYLTDTLARITAGHPISASPN